jgi:hypothetical protein
MSSKGLASILCLGWVLFSPVVTQAQSDTWENATAITNGLTSGNNLSATTGSPTGSCTLMLNDVWYFYVAPCTGTAIATMCFPGGATFDCVVAAWFAPLACGAPRPGEIACNDDFCGLRSYVSFAVQAGKTYYLSIGGYAGDTGSFTLSLSCSTSAGPPPVNDTCTSAKPMNSTALLTGTTVGATSGGSDPVGTCGGMSKDVWYYFTAPQFETYVVTTCLPGADFDTVIAVWAGPGCALLTQIGCNDDACYPGGPGGLKSTVTFNAAAGATYRISVGGFGGDSGYFNLSLRPVSAMDLSIGLSAPGQIGFSVTQGPPNGTYFAALTLNQGNFPNGWFFGIDILGQDLGQQLLGSAPFWGPLSSCGNTFVGPFTGLPAGLTLYGVAFGFTTFGSMPVLISGPDSGTVQ